MKGAGDVEDLVRTARGGVLVTEWAYWAGWPRGRLRGEGWQRICRGAWAVPGKEVDWRVRARMVQLRRPEWVCSHRTAAALHCVEVLNGGVLNSGGAEGEEVPVLEFTMLRRGGRGVSFGAGLRVHTTVLLTERDVSVRAVLRVTDRFNALAECPSVRRILRFTATEVFHHRDRVIARIRAVLATQPWRASTLSGGVGNDGAHE